jgi:alkylation response protein AidB-like acyl-CoA dehydrogenase
MSDYPSPPGGSFLVQDTDPTTILTPEALPAEARLMAKSVEEFVRKEVLPKVEQIDAHEEGLMPGMVRKAGELGLLGADLPECYGGYGLRKPTITLLVERSALQGSFSVSIGAHTVIGSLPILYFGTPEQKAKYLPKLATGEWIGAFALSEAGCGSDALSSKTKATLTPEGDAYLLTGEKMWTTNAGFADLITIFAKVDGEKFSAFLVEKTFPGLTLGREEHKLGIKGSSTRRIILENCRVPVENVLGEIGQAHRVALYVLNIGRFNLGVGGLGASKEALKLGAAYARQRVQFGTPIASFGMIQHKLGEMAARLFALESTVYRTAGYWDGKFGAVVPTADDANDQYRAAAEEYAIECAIMKFFGSETLDFVVDEALQIHGGFGYTEEFPMARMYRDARINRIFEGTNEINRLMVVDQMVRRAMRGRLGLVEAGAKVKDVLLSPPGMGAPGDPLAEIAGWVSGLRLLTLYVAGQAWETLGEGMAKAQEVCGCVADLVAGLYALESAYLRCKSGKLTGKALENAIAATQVYGTGVCDQAEATARTALAAFSSGDTLRTHAASARRLLKAPLTDTIALRRQLAAAVHDADGWPWG